MEDENWMGILGLGVGEFLGGPSIFGCFFRCFLFGSLLGFHPFFVYVFVFRCLLCDFLVMVKPLHITDVHRIFTGKSIVNCFVLFTQDFCSTKYISKFCTCPLSHVWMHVQHCSRSI